jgi:hypothetical protein
MSGEVERMYINNQLIPELQKRMDVWGTEYRQPRDLGVRGEFAGLYRKVRKLKSVIWDGVDASHWREDPRTIMMEVVAHALLAIHDMDREHGLQTEEMPSKSVSTRDVLSENIRDLRGELNRGRP